MFTTEWRLNQRLTPESIEKIRITNELKGLVEQCAPYARAAYQREIIKQIYEERDKHFNDFKEKNNIEDKKYLKETLVALQKGQVLDYTVVNERIRYIDNQDALISKIKVIFAYNRPHPIIQSYLDVAKNLQLDIKLETPLMTYKDGIEAHARYLSEGNKADIHPIEAECVKLRNIIIQCLHTKRSNDYDMNREINTEINKLGFRASNGVRGYNEEYTIEKITQMHSEFMEKYNAAMAYKVD